MPLLTADGLGRPGLDTGAWAAWVLGCGPFSSWAGGSFQNWSHPSPYPGEREAAAARAGLVGRGFLAILGVKASWFRQASCVGVRVRGQRGTSGVLA